MRTRGTTLLSAVCRRSLHHIEISPEVLPATNRSGTSNPDGNRVAAECAVRISLDRVRLQRSLCVRIEAAIRRAQLRTHASSGQVRMQSASSRALPGRSFSRGFSAMGGRLPERRPPVS